MSLGIENVNEWVELPENPRRMTFRGRYSHVDNWFVSTLQLDSSMPNIRVLDVCCGVLSFGSPTMHDLWDILELCGKKPCMIGIDRDIPTVKSRYPIVYKRELQEIPSTEMFDIVRLLHVVEHASHEEYGVLRAQALKHLRNGGIFICLQEVGYWKRYSGGEDVKSLPNIIKVMQRRDTEVIPIAFLPDAIIPWPQGLAMLGRDSAEEYQAFRQCVKNGTTILDRQVDTHGYNTSMTWLPLYLMEILKKYESRYTTNVCGWDRGRKEGDVYFDIERLEELLGDTLLWF